GVYCDEPVTPPSGRHDRDRHSGPTRRSSDLEMDWETIRWPGETGKMLFHPTPEEPTLPNAGLLRLEPGAYHPWHRHDFAQVWYIDRKSTRLNSSHVKISYAVFCL